MNYQVSAIMLCVVRICMQCHTSPHCLKQTGIYWEAGIRKIKKVLGGTYDDLVNTLSKIKF